MPPGVPVGFVNETDAPEQTLSSPVIVPAIGKGLTVKGWFTDNDPQLNVVEVNEIVVVVKAVATPVTTPVGETVATAEDKLLQVPPGAPVALASVTEAPEQTLSAPVIAPALGNALTVTAKLVDTEPQLNVLTV